MFKIIVIPFDPKSGQFDDDLLKRFALNKRIVAYLTEFFVNDGTVSPAFDYAPTLSF